MGNNTAKQGISNGPVEPGITTVDINTQPSIPGIVAPAKLDSIEEKSPTLKENVKTKPVEPNPEIDIPFPSRLHVTLSGEWIENRPLVVVGDVHGCLEELKELVETVRSTEPDCVFLFCGDLVNKGPSSLDTIKFVRALGDSAYTVRGNHEDHTIDRWLKWKQSAVDIPKKKFAWSVGLSLEEAEWLMELPYTISVPHMNAIIVHAGFMPGRTLEEQRPWDMTEMRDVKDGDPSKERIGTAWAQLWKGPQHVYFGHDARRKLQQQPYATGLDTGCVFGFQLTAQYLTGDKRLLTIQAKQSYKKAKK